MPEYLVDTDVFIWYLRGHEGARSLFHSIEFAISVVTYMELIQGMRNKQELRALQKMIRAWRIRVIYIDEEISAKALHGMESFFLSHSCQMADALIAATCSKYGLKLLTANEKHYRVFDEIEIERFQP
jgi:predicted nucleic acid-binding protein